MQSDLLSWARYNGFSISDSVELAKSDTEGYFVRAKNAIEQEDHLIVSCPKQFVISSQLSIELFESFVGRDVASSQPFVKVALLWEKQLGEASKWFPYISHLPLPDELTIPFYFSSEDFEWLQGTNLQADIEIKRNIWKEEWLEILKRVSSTLLDLSPFSLDSYIWASIIFTSRSFPARILFPGESDNKSILLPIIDLLNHQPLSKVQWDATSGDAFELRCGPIAKGDQVFNNYGAKGNEELLMGYGFCIEGNPVDSISLKLKLASDKIAELQQQGVPVPSDGLFHLSLQDPLPDSLIKTFEIMINDNGQAGSIVRLRALDALKGSLTAKSNLLSAHPPLPPKNIKQRFAQIYRNGQELIYKRCIDECSLQLKELMTDLAAQNALLNLDSLKSDSLRFKFLESISNLFIGRLDVETLRSQGLEDQILLLFITLYSLGDNQFSEFSRNMHLSDEQLAEYEDMFIDFGPLVDKVCPELVESRWSVKSLACAGAILEAFGYEFVDSSGQSIYSVILEGSE